MDHEDRWAQLRALATSPAIGVADQRRLLDGAEPRLRVLLAGNPAIHPGIQRELADDRWCWAALGANPGLAVAVQHVMAASPWPDVQRALLRHPHPDPAVQQVLAAADDDEVRLGLAAHPALAPAAAERLAGQTRVPAQLAANPAIPPAMLDRFLHGGDTRLRCAAARNPALDARQQETLAGDPSEAVRSSLARNPGLDPACAQALLSGPAAVLRALAGNPAVGAAIVAQLAERCAADLALRTALAGNPWLAEHVQQRYAVAGGPRVAAALAGNPSLTGPVQQILATASEPAVRASLAANPSLHPDAAAVLAADPETAVRLRLAASPALPSAARTRLLQDEEVQVVVQMVRRADYDRADLRTLLLSIVVDDDHWAPARVALRRMARWDDLGAWGAAVLDLPLTGPAAVAITDRDDLARRCVRHPDQLLRIAAMARGYIDPDVATAMFNDPDPAVAHAAKLAVLRCI